MDATKRILLADTGVEFRAILSDALAKEPDFQVVGETADGAELVALARELKPDAVIMEMVLTGMDGLEVLRSQYYLPDYASYVCPTSETTAGSGKEPLTDLNCDYVYLGGLALYHDWSKDCPVAFERPGSHSKDRINILYGDGRVNIVRLPDTVQTVTDLLEYLAGQTDDPDVKAFLLRKRQTFF